MKTSNKLLTGYFIICIIQITIIYIMAVRSFSEKSKYYKNEINQEWIIEEESVPEFDINDFIH